VCQQIVIDNNGHLIFTGDLTPNSTQKLGRKLRKRITSDEWFWWMIFLKTTKK